MPEEYLTLREFGDWRREHDKKIDRLLELGETQGRLNLDTAVRLNTLEVNRENDRSHSAKWTTVIAAAISAAIGGMFALLRG